MLGASALYMAIGDDPFRTGNTGNYLIGPRASLYFHSCDTFVGRWTSLEETNYLNSFRLPSAAYISSSLNHSPRAHHHLMQLASHKRRSFGTLCGR